jgi:hypothetical protein
MEQVIYLDDKDDVASIRERLRRARSKRILLVVPRRCKALSRTLDLKLLRRYAEELSIEVAIVSSNPRTREIAKEEGFPVFLMVSIGKRVRWKGRKGRAHLGWIEPIAAFIVFIGVLAFLLGGAVSILPSTKVTLVPETIDISCSLSVQASPEFDRIDFNSFRIPASVIKEEVEGKASILTTGTKDSPEEKAKGNVIFINKTNSPIVIPKGTVVATSTGTIVRFITTEEANLPGEVGGIARVGVEAVLPGPSGNVGVNIINRVEGPLGLQVRVTNDEPTAGGTAKRVRVVTAVDKERLKDSLLQQLVSSAHSMMEEGLEEGEFVPKDSLRVDYILTEIYDKFVGEEADSLSLEMKAMVSGVVIDEGDARKLVYKVLESKVVEGYELVDRSFLFERGEVTKVDEEERNVTFAVRGSGFVIAKIDSGSVKEAIRGRGLDFAKEYLVENLPLEAEPFIEVEPDWFGRVSYFPFRIEVVIEGI